MVRYDKKNTSSFTSNSFSKEGKEGNEGNEVLKQVTYDKEHIEKLKELVAFKLKNIEINDKLFVMDITEDTIVLNSNISMQEIQETLNLHDTKTKLDFIREFLLFNLDDFTNSVYKEKVIAIKEPIISLTQVQVDNENVIQYIFL